MPRGSGAGFTGANAIPLGPRNPAIGAKRSFSSVPPPEQPSLLRQPLPPAPPGPPQISGKAAEALRAAQAAAANLQAKKFANSCEYIQFSIFGFLGAWGETLKEHA